MLQRISYHYRVYIVFVLIFFLILLGSGIFFYQYNVNLLQEEAQQNAMDSLSVMQVRIDDCFETMDTIAKKLHASPKFMSTIKEIDYSESNYFIGNPRSKTQLSDMILSEIVGEQLSMNVHFVSRYHDYMGVFMNLFPYERKMLSKQEIENLPTVREGLSTKKYRIFRAPHESEWVSGNQQVFSVMRPLRDNYNTYGMLEVCQDIKEFETMLQITNMMDDYEIFLLDQDKNLLYTSDKAAYRDAEKIVERININEKKSGMSYSANDQLLCYQTSAITGWTLVMERQLKTLKSSRQSLGKMIGLTYLLVSILGIGVLYFISRSLTRPLVQLKDNLYKLQTNQEIHLNLKSNSNEVAVLATAIEEILNKIKQQNNIIVQERKRAAQAHVDMLEAQLNPHFLYNTLAVIGACGYEEGSSRVYKMCQDLAELLRYSIKYEYKLVKMKDEIQNIHNYLAIMKMRYEDMVEIEWHLEEALADITLPKLILQPIVENCFKHGFVNQPPIWKIQIYSYQEDEKWIVEIRNNGSVFTKEDRERICENYLLFREDYIGIEEKQAPKKGFGLENTLKRLFIEYGEEAYIKIYVEEEWSVVEIGGLKREQKD